MRNFTFPQLIPWTTSLFIFETWWKGLKQKRIEVSGWSSAPQGQEFEGENPKEKGVLPQIYIQIDLKFLAYLCSIFNLKRFQRTPKKGKKKRKQLEI